MSNFGLEQIFYNFWWSCFLKLTIFGKNQCLKHHFIHKSCQHKQEYASQGGMGDENSNFSLISIFVEEFYGTF